MINTKRFYLRKFKIQDAQFMFNNWASDLEVTKYLTWNPHKSIDDSKEFIKAFEENRVIHDLCKRCGFRRKFEK